MLQSKSIGSALEREIEALTEEPASGRVTARTRVTLRPQLECLIEDGGWTMTAGAPATTGGNEAGPDPDAFGRGALGSCLAMGYATLASRMGVEIEELMVEVLAEFDRRGELGIADEVMPGYQTITYRVTVVSPAPTDVVQLVLDTADRYNRYRDIFGRTIPIAREVHIHTHRSAAFMPAARPVAHAQKKL